MLAWRRGCRDARRLLTVGEEAQGLVCITPGAGYMGITGAFVSGLLAGPTCFFACQLKKTFKFDDALDAFGIHGPGGILGGLLTGLFAKEEMTIGVFEPGVGVKGAFEGNAFQILLQLYGIIDAPRRAPSRQCACGGPSDAGCCWGACC